MGRIGRQRKKKRFCIFKPDGRRFNGGHHKKDPFENCPPSVENSEEQPWGFDKVLMEVDDDSVVDLSVSSRRGPSIVDWSNRPASESSRRSLRPRTEVTSYAEAPDVVVVSDDEPRLNGYSNGVDDSDLSDSEMPPLPPIKELSPAELKEREERERFVRKLRDELRNEEMTLVLLKKLRQSQQMKENIAVVPTTNVQTPTLPPNIKLPPSSSLQITPTSQPAPQSSARTNHQHSKSSSNTVPPLVRGQHPPMRNGQSNAAPLAHLTGNRSLAPGMPANMHVTSPNVQKGNSRNSNSNVNMSFSGNSAADRLKDSHHTPSPQVDRSRQEENQTPAQRQAAAKLALRKQLEKTLLQIPPPKPPPPEMHFIPNPSNTEFIYLLGLEYIVDYITKSHDKPAAPEPFRCSQCSTSFTPVWKWEKSTVKGKDPKVLCEQCVTTNVKKALKAEHTNRLKTAFVKALQQEQEIEQRLAQSSPQPSEAPPTPSPAPPPVPKPVTPTHAPPPPPPPQARRNPTPPTPSPVPSPSPREHPLAKLAAETNKFNSHHAAAALHQQLLRGLPQHQPPLPAHMMPFSHLLYPYQLAAMAQASGNKGSVAAAAANLVELQRQAADLQRQYLLDLIPNPGSSRSHGPSMNNWKT